MKTKEYLLQIHRRDMQIGQRITQLQHMRDRIHIMGSFDYSRDRVQSTPTSGNKQIDDLVDFENQLLEMIKEEQKLKDKIITEIQQLEDPVHVEILFRRYVAWKSLKQIANDMNYAYQYVVNLHGQALKEFAKKVSIP